ncbi:MAG TPA: high-affinity nickel-transport family protein [Thermoanaerobaculia bacterium]
MFSALSILSLGLLLGLRHATDSDHVIAVSTIVSRERSLAKAARIGALWGVGHSLTILAVGAPLILFRWTISPNLGAAMELAVALMLIVLGVASLIDVRRGTTSNSSHSHFHRHGDHIHRHPHLHETAGSPHDDAAHGHAEDATALGAIDRAAGRLRAYGLIRPVVVGVVHGLAGSAAIAVMVLAAIRTPLLAVGYLLVFGLGTILGMVMLTTAIALPVVATGNRSLATNRSLRIAFALVSLCFGVFLAIRIGIPLAQM